MCSRWQLLFVGINNLDHLTTFLRVLSNSIHQTEIELQYDLHCIHFICHSQDVVAQLVNAHIISPFVNFQESTPTITQVPAYFSETNDSLSSTNQEGLELKNNHSTVIIQATVMGTWLLIMLSLLLTRK